MAPCFWTESKYLFIDNPMLFRAWLEGAEEDRRVSNLASRVWDRIVKGFDSLPLESMSVSVPKVRGGEREVSGWGFDLGVLFPEFSGLRVLMCHFPDRGASAAYDHRTGTIFIPILAEGEEGLERLVRIRFRAWGGSYKMPFVHEFVHYLDHMRGVKFRGGDREPSGSFKDRDEYESRRVGDYLNTPEEFNAYYQSLLAVLNKKLRPADFRADFPDFLRRVSEMVPGFEREGRSGASWPERLDDSYRRRFVSRLYGYYLSRRG